MTSMGTNIELASELLKAGDLVAIPTETVYGLAGNGIDEKAVAHIFKVKDRPKFDPMILHFSSLNDVLPYVGFVPKVAYQLAISFWPGPMTLLLPKSDLVPDLVTAGLSNVAVRVPSHPMALELLTWLDFPLAAPSANPFGYVSPTSAQHVMDQLNGMIPYILDGGNCHVGLESTIIDVSSEEVVILRKGGVSIERIEEVIGPIRVAEHSTSRPSAPGMLKSHYAPRTPLSDRSIEDLLNQFRAEEIGGLWFERKQEDLPEQNQIVLSARGDLEEAAKNFFMAVRELDKMNLKVIATQLLPEKDLGRAINDKLRRAMAGL